MAHNIKVSADFTSVKKSITEISSALKDLSKKQSVSLFDKESIEFLKGAATDALSSMQNGMDALTAKSKALRDEYRQEGQSLDQLAKKRHEILAIDKERVKLQGDMNKLEKSSSTLGKGGFSGGLMESLSKIPGIGKLAGLAAGGLGIGAIAGLGVGAAAVGTGYYGYKRGEEGYNQYSQGIDSRIKLRGRGVKDVDGLHTGLSGLGYAPEDIRQAQIQSSESFGSANSGTEDIYKRAKFAKGVGLDLGQVQGVGSQLRSSMGVDQASKAFANLQGNIIAKGIKDAVGPYLETAASMLTDLNENGMGFDKGALDALGNLVSKSGISAERASSTIMGVNQSIQGATGERSAFYQDAAASAGLGDKTLGGAKEAANLGLFGLDPEKGKKMLTADQYKHYQQMGLIGNSGYMKKFIGGIESRMPKFENTKEGDLQKGRFLEGEGIGHGSSASALSTWNLMQTATKGGKPADEARRTLESDFKSPEETMKSIMGDTKQINEIIGMKIAPSIASSKDSLNSIDRTVLGIAQRMGVEMPDEKGVKAKPTAALKGLDALTDSLSDVLLGYLTQIRTILQQQLDVAHSTDRAVKKPKGAVPSQRKGVR